MYIYQNDTSVSWICTKIQEFGMWVECIIITGLSVKPCKPYGLINRRYFCNKAALWTRKICSISLEGKLASERKSSNGPNIWQRSPKLVAHIDKKRQSCRGRVRETFWNPFHIKQNVFNDRLLEKKQRINLPDNIINISVFKYIFVFMRLLLLSDLQIFSNYSKICVTIQPIKNS